MRDIKSVRQLDKNRLNRRLRKNNNNLVISGVGVIFFGLWSVLKFVEELLLGKMSLYDLIDENEPDILLEKVYIIIVTAVVFLIILLYHYYIGRSSIAVGRGRKKKRLYILLAFITLIITIIGLPEYFSPESIEADVDMSIASFLVDITLCIALFDMIISSFTVMYLKKKLGEFD